MDFFTAIASKLVEIVLPTLATAIAGLIVALLSKYLKKVKIELTVEQETRLRQVVEDAIRATEEAARRQAAKGIRMTSHEKEQLTARAVLQKMPDVPAGQLKLAVDAMLPEVRNWLKTGAN